MGKVSKATKKFQSKHLKHTLDHRKKVKEHNKKIQGRRGNKSEQQKKDAQLTKEEQALLKSSKEEVFKDMSVENFFAGGFDIPKKDKRMKKKQEKQESDDDSSSEDEDVEKDMADLANKDPEFYKYLQENDKDLLEFKSSNPLDGISGDEEEEGEEMHDPDTEVTKKQAVKDSKDEKVEVTLKMVTKWKKDLKTAPSVKLAYQKHLLCLQSRS